MTEDEREGVSGLWFKGLNEDERRRMHETLAASQTQFDALRKILESLYRTAQTQSDNATEPLEIVRRDGYKKALRDVYTILPKTKRNKR